MGFPPLTEKRNAAFLSSVFLTIQASKKGTVLRMKSRSALEQLPTMLHAESALKSLTPDQLEKAGLPSPCSLSNLVSTVKRSSSIKSSSKCGQRSSGRRPSITAPKYNRHFSTPD